MSGPSGANEGAVPSEATKAGLSTPMSMIQQGAAEPPPRIWDLIIGPEASYWSSLLVRDHLGSESRLALSTTCTAARDMVLVTAEQATLTLCKGCEQLTGSMLRRTRASLQLRGRLSTQLHLGANLCMVAYALGVLEEGLTWVEELGVFAEALATGLPTTTLATMGRCCPNAHTLTIRTPLPELPSPDLFPKVQKLDTTIGPNTKAQVFRSVSPYLKQLKHLALAPDNYTWPPEHILAPHLPRLLFSTSNVATHLHTLHIPATLDDTLLGLLLQCAPALEEVMVCSLHLQTYTHTQATAGWRVLTTNELHVGSLARLPLAPRLQVVLGASDMTWDNWDNLAPPILVCDLHSWAEASAARLIPVQCNKSLLHIKPGEDVRPRGQPTALCLSLIVMSAWPDGPPELDTLYFQGWTISVRLASEFKGLPEASTLSLENSVWLPDVSECGTLLRMLPDSYDIVDILAEGLTEAQVESICLGAPRDRTQHTSLDVIFHHLQFSQAILDRVYEDDFPHVTFCW